MIIFLGYMENRNKKVLLSDKHSAQIVYQIDGIDAGIYSIENAGTLLKELNDVSDIVSAWRGPTCPPAPKPPPPEGHRPPNPPGSS